MKKSFLTIILTLILCTCSYLTGYKIGLKKEKNIKNIQNHTFDNITLIDKEHKKCYEFSHPYYFPNCSATNEKNWLEEIENDLYLLKNIMNIDDYKLIENNQKLWEAYVDNTYKIIEKFIFTEHDAYHLTYANKALALTSRQRAILLKTLYFFVTGEETKQTYEAEGKNNLNNAQPEETVTFDEFLNDDTKYKFIELSINDKNEALYKGKKLLNKNGEVLTFENAQSTSELKLMAGLNGYVPENCDPADTAKNGSYGCYIATPDEE